MPTTEPPFTCATCEAVIGHHPTFHVGLAFCCAGCVADGPCICSYDLEVSDGPVDPLALAPSSGHVRADDLGRLVGAAH